MQTLDQLDQNTRAVVPRALDYCFFAGYSEGVQVSTVSAPEQGYKDKDKDSNNKKNKGEENEKEDKGGKGSHEDKEKEKEEMVQVSVEVHGPAVPAGDQLQRCADSLRGLLRTTTEGNAFCNEAFNGE